MKTTFTNKILVCLSLIFLSISVNAQYGLEKVIVEKYYVSNADDSIASMGTLPVGSVTWRIYLDMLPGVRFTTAYGSPQHDLLITTTTKFFNNEDRGATSPTYSIAKAKNNTVMLDSWLTAGAACVGNLGILKSEDNGVNTVVNADGILQNADTSAGIPLTTQDGLIAGTPGECGFIGLTDSALAVFDATSQLGNTFKVTNGSWYCLAGAKGADSASNKVLIAQITTKGQLHFKLNVQLLAAPEDTAQLYVSDSITNGSEIYFPGLTWTSPKDSPIHVNVPDVKNSFKPLLSIFPNPTSGIVNLNISSVKGNTNTHDYYKIYNLVGSVILKKNITNTLNYTEKIDMSAYANGVYFIEVSLNGVKSTHKLIKN